jgi:hypothetical protein
VSITIRGQVGPQVLTDGTEQPFRLGKTGETIVTELQARYFEQVYRGNCFTAVSAAATSSAGLNATYTGGCVVSNPASSNKILVVLKASSAMTVISTAVTTAGVFAGWSQAGVVTHTTALTPTSLLLGSQLPSIGKADQAATLPGTPAYVIAGFASTGIAAGMFGAAIDLEGLVVVPPGGYCGVATSIASAATAMICSMTWCEVPA